MKKKILALTLVALMALSTTPYFLPTATAPTPSPGPGPVYHWKIMLAQRNCNAWIEGVLTFQGTPILGTEFSLVCICDLPEPQPLGQFVFWKVPTDVVPTDIDYIKYIDTNKDGIPDITEPITGDLTFDDPTEPHTYYQHLEEGTGQLGPWMVVVEVREQPYQEERPYFDWQITMKSHGVDASLTGWLTKDAVKLVGTDFDLVCDTRADKLVDLQCKVVRTPYCTVPNDIHAELLIGGMPPAIVIDETFHQFPWKYRYYVDPPSVYVDLELTEVQSYHYVVMGGETTSDGQLGTFDPWYMGEPGGVPFATRDPSLTPMFLGQNITFTQRDPITGVVKLGVPTESYDGLDHTYYSERVGTYFRVQIFLPTQGCGWLFTGIGKDPILGDVDLITYANNNGVYSSAGDVLLAGRVPNVDDPDPPGPTTHAAGAGPPLSACLQDIVFRGPDDIPGTGDDIFGDGQPDPPGSSILFLPSRMEVTYWSGSAWVPLFGSPWPQIFTTATSTNTIIEQGSAIDGVSYSATGYPWEFLAGIQGAAPYKGPVPWKHDKCNAFVKYVCMWSCMEVDTDLGLLDVHFLVWEKKVRGFAQAGKPADCVIADADCNQKVNILDILVAAVAFGTQDEGFGNPVADPKYDARADLADPRGTINILDVLKMAVDFGKQITPQCVIKT